MSPILSRTSVRLPLILAALAAGTAEAQSEATLDAPAPVEPAPRVRVALEGTVLEPDGTPARGAVVVTSAGGAAVTDEAGTYRLTVDVPLEAETLEVMAVAAGDAGRSSATVAVGAGGRRACPLRLGQGSCASSWLPAFGGQPALSHSVHALAVYDDGSGPALHAAGRFTLAGGVAANRVARWDGARWSALGDGMDGPVYALAVCDYGSGPALYAGGDFVSAGGELVRRIARWDGASWSALGSGLSGGGQRGPVYALAVFDDGHGAALYAGGGFETAGDAPAPRIARWDGAEWSGLDDGVGANFRSSRVYALVVHDDGSGPALYAGGLFDNASNVPMNAIARWDGASWSALGSGAFELGSVVRALTVHDDGGGPALYAGGQFQSAGGAPANRVARWDGTAWSGLAGGTSHQVQALVSHDDGSGTALYAGTSTTEPDASGMAGVLRWDGTSWSAHGQGLASGAVLALVVHDDGSGPALHAGSGTSLTITGPPGRVARWDGAAWRGLGGGPNGAVETLAELEQGGVPALVVGGQLTVIGGIAATGVATWSAPAWSALGTLGDDSRVAAVAVRDEGSGPVLYAGGSFTSADGVTAGRIARWDGAGWSPLGIGMNASVEALAFFDDGSGHALYAGGAFTTADGAPASHVAKWDGTGWSALGVGVIAQVWALRVHDDGSGPALYVGGLFPGGLARWNGTTWSALPANLDGYVQALAVHDDGSGAALYVGGLFTSAGGTPANRIARWDGAAWSALGSGASATVRALASFDDGSGPALYAGGDFTIAGGLAVGRIARWDGASWSALGAGVTGGSPTVETLLVHDAGDGPDLYVGGHFQVSPARDSFLARYGRDRTARLLAPAPVVALDALGSAPGEVVHFTVSALDDTDPAPSVVCVPPSGSFFPRGTTLVTCTATDACGNEATAQFPVTVMAKARRR